jgi:primosomal protein N' (replication factor Y) (superfamily II helicase)
MPDPSDNSSATHAFVEVALPLPPRQTFTYKLPDETASRVQLGSRVLVPFANRTITGYVVAVHATLDAELGIDEAAVKQVTQLIDETPLVNEEILALTKWTADYYAASWGEMLKASLPAGVNATVVQFVSITDRGRQHLLQTRSLKSMRDQILKRLSLSDETQRTDLEKEFGAATSKRAIRELNRAGLVNLRDHAASEKVKPKRRKAVKLLELSAVDDDRKAPNESQQRILDQLRDNNGAMTFTDLLERAGVGASSINTLAKRGWLEVFTTEVRRDPFTGTNISNHEKIVLNAEQDFVLNEISQGLSAFEYRGFLLHGVTGSGKTEVYIRAMRETLDAGRSSLMNCIDAGLLASSAFGVRLRCRDPAFELIAGGTLRRMASHQAR